MNKPKRKSTGRPRNRASKPRSWSTEEGTNNVLDLPKEITGKREFIRVTTTDPYDNEKAEVYKNKHTDFLETFRAEGLIDEAEYIAGVTFKKMHDAIHHNIRAIDYTVERVDGCGSYSDDFKDKYRPRYNSVLNALGSQPDASLLQAACDGLQTVIDANKPRLAFILRNLVSAMDMIAKGRVN